jgi:8-oxo-dGTP pyrophosphatase MutT (NUDIX family)
MAENTRRRRRFAWMASSRASQFFARRAGSITRCEVILHRPLTPSGKIPIVRQYRPAIEAFAWELPAGLVDPGEAPAEGCRRELLEETGLSARAVHALGTNCACTGRFSNRIHNFFVAAGARVADFEPEPGISMKLVSPAESSA